MIYIDYEEYEKALEPLVLNVLVHLRANGIIEGPLLPSRRPPAGEVKKTHSYSGGGGERIVLSSMKARKVHIVPTKPGAIEFYEKVRPTFESAYDSISLPWPLALSLDSNLYFKCLANGPGVETVDKFLKHCEAMNRDDLIVSLEESLQVQNDDGDEYTVERDISPLEQDALSDIAHRAVQKWGKPPPRHPVDGTKPVYGRILCDYRPRIGGFHIMECDSCKRGADKLYLLRKREICGKCVPQENERRRAKGYSLIYATSRQVAYH